MPESKADVQIVYAEPLKRFCIASARKADLSPADAELLADTLVRADLRGVHSHGVTRLAGYIKGYQSEGVNPHPQIKVIKDSGAMAVMDGNDGLGLIVSYPAMKLAMNKAGEYGVGVVTVRQSNHCGMMAYWSMMALERDMIGYCTTNASPTMAPWGGITLSYGNNPMSYALPAGKELPIVLDMAMSVVAKGKIRVASLTKKAIPLGWAMDKYGEPTTDSLAAMDGLLMPVGGYKGYGIAVVNDILCGVLADGRFGREIPEARAGGGTSIMGYCHFFMALDIAHFTSVARFKERVDTYIHMMKSSQLAKGHGRIYMPGEIEFELHRRRLKEGIPLSSGIVNQLQELAKDINIPADFLA